MPPILRRILAVLAGMVTGFVLVALVESAGHTVYPPPKDIDFTDPAALNAYVRSIPLGALLFVLLAWVVGTFGGAWVAARLAGRQPMLHAGIIGALLLAASVANLIAIPHPVWFSVSAVVLVPLSAWRAGRLAADSAGRAAART